MKGSHAKELQYEKRCLMASLALVELQKNDKNITDYLKDCKKQYLESRHAAEVIEDNDDSETHLHIHALVSLFKILKTKIDPVRRFDLKHTIWGNSCTKSIRNACTYQVLTLYVT